MEDEPTTFGLSHEKLARLWKVADETPADQDGPAKDQRRAELLRDRLAVDYIVNTDETVFFMFDPFDEVVLSKVLDNIAASVERQPRQIVIVYCRSVPGSVFEQRENLAKWGEFHFGGYHFTVYSNSRTPCPEPAGV